ncbi:MAG: HD domain-containing protein, partial [Actinomycetia bacterium]|nr:HD domain-containing protein [Actinomycetes bacterium]
TAALILIAKKAYSEFEKSQLEIIKTVSNQASAALENIYLYKELESVFIQTISALSSAIEAKDVYTRGHSEGVVIHSLKLAEVLNLNEEKKETIRIAGLLHDIGKIGIGEGILTKPGPLSSEERTLINTHPLIGANIIKTVKMLKPVVNIILSHHEWHNGKGYPKGLKGKEICMEAKILAIADAFDAMTSKRAYRDALSFKEAVKRIKEGAGTQFDPKLAKEFVKVIK